MDCLDVISTQSELLVLKLESVENIRKRFTLPPQYSFKFLTPLIRLRRFCIKATRDSTGYQAMPNAEDEARANGETSP